MWNLEPVLDGSNWLFAERVIKKRAHMGMQEAQNRERLEIGWGGIKQVAVTYPERRFLCLNLLFICSFFWFLAHSVLFFFCFLAVLCYLQDTIFPPHPFLLALFSFDVQLHILYTFVHLHNSVSLYLFVLYTHPGSRSFRVGYVSFTGVVV